MDVHSIFVANHLLPPSLIPSSSTSYLFTPNRFSDLDSSMYCNTLLNRDQIEDTQQQDHDHHCDTTTV